MCKSPDILLTTTEVLNTRRVVGWPIIWYCLNCQAAVSCVDQSYSPMGKMATPDVRLLRIYTHEVFDVLWKDFHMSRTQAYEWMARKLHIHEPHISELSPDDLATVIEHVHDYFRKLETKNYRMDTHHANSLQRALKAVNERSSTNRNRRS